MTNNGSSRRRATWPRRDAIAFDPLPLISKIAKGCSSREYSRDEGIFAQGDAADAVFYIESGKVKVTVLSGRGKTAVVGTLGRGSFFGEGCLGGQKLRVSSARTAANSRISRIEKKAMLRLLRREPEVAGLFTAYLLSRNARIEGDLVTQIFNSSEKRLARLLLRLAHFGKPSKPLNVIPKMSRETLASMVGTTPLKAGHFMDRFRKMGFINDDDDVGLKVHHGLLAVVLRDGA